MTKLNYTSGDQMRKRGSGLAVAGFTLVELLTVLAIIGIVMAIAIPSYREQVRKTRRADAKATLLEISQFMERTYTSCNTYAKMTAPACTINVVSPFLQSPKTGTKFYTLAVASSSATAFNLTAVPAGDQVGDSCGTLSITQTGAKSPSTTGCW